MLSLRETIPRKTMIDAHSKLANAFWPDFARDQRFFPPSDQRLLKMVCLLLLIRPIGVLNYKRAELARLVDHFMNAREVLAGHPYLEVIPLGDRDQFR